MRTISILVFIACFAVSIGGDGPHQFWEELVFGANAGGIARAS